MKTIAIIAALLLPVTAFAADEASEPTVRGQGWSVLSGKTIGENATVVSAAAGWPGLSAQALYGATNRVDFGLRLSFNYGFEGMVNFVQPGIKVQGVVHVTLLDKSKFNLGLEFAPGPLFYFNNYNYYGTNTVVGLALPFSLTAGVPIGSAILLHGSLDIPMFATFGSLGRLWFPMLLGAGVEYFIDRNLAATFTMKMGPSIDTADNNRRGGPTAWFDLQAMIGVAYKL